MEYNITPQSIFEQTNGGLDIIERYYPEAGKIAENGKGLFKLRSGERTASASLRAYDGVYWVKDFGSTDKAMNAVDLIMSEERLEFKEALNYIVREFNLETKDSSKEKSGYDYEKLEPESDEVVGTIDFNPKKFDRKTLQTIFSNTVWNRLKGLNRKPDKNGQLEPKSDDLAEKNAMAICKQYGLVNLEYYTQVSADKNNKGKRAKHKFKANDQFPILMWEAGKWRKIYKPKERNKKFRFVIQGNKTHVMFGASEVEKMLQERIDQEMTRRNLSWGSEDEKVQKQVQEIDRMKLDEIIICSGGSDALNVAACGYPVIWFDNEMFKLSSEEYSWLFGHAHRVYYLPDIDDSGIKAAVELGKEHLNIELIFLPKSLGREYDLRGNACKDVRDFFRKNSPSDFKNLVAKAKPMRFWDAKVKLDKKGNEVVSKGRTQWTFTPNQELIINFLYLCGYSEYEIESAKKGAMIIKEVDGIVKADIEFKHIYREIKNFLGTDPVMRLVKHGYIDLVNAFNRSPQFNESSIMHKLPPRFIDFTAWGKRYQYLFLENQAWKIFSDRVEDTKITDAGIKVWENDVLPYRVKLEDPDFIITQNSEGLMDIDIKSSDNMYLNFLIQTSRIHWQEELEVQLDAIDFEDPNAVTSSGKKVSQLGVKSKDEYREKYLFAIDGPLLSADHVREQKLVLISKLVCMGYLLHGYKDKADAYCPWVTDHNGEQVTEEAQSYGGTGKTIYFDFLQLFMKTHQLDGQDRKLMEDKHILEGVNKHTRMVYVDDAGKYLQFEMFFAWVTSFMKVNPKGTAAYTLPFPESPKLAISSNLPPKKNDPSTRRRMWFLTFSSYYHKNANGEFREERAPKDEFKCTLFGDDFPKEQWGKSINLAARSIQYWLRFGKINSIEDTILRNMLIQKMTLNFKSWADEIFHPDNNRLNTEVQRSPLYQLYLKVNSYKLSPQGFMDRLAAWCEYNGFVLNPTKMRGKDGRIMRHVEKEELRGNSIVLIEVPGKPGMYEKGTREVIYIDTKGVGPFEPMSPDTSNHGENTKIEGVNDEEIKFGDGQDLDF
ncbi:primase-helicase family protein [Jiulongibacter sp. NS-SX5]|uniref:primase-helicase family protein n=1 Tax=Jiulongibacter sp. NS-SX5 TaxID=3463854 RepID=UPI004059370B